MPVEGWLHMVVTPGGGDVSCRLFVTHDGYELVGLSPGAKLLM
jgi:hypothetical protein